MVAIAYQSGYHFFQNEEVAEVKVPNMGEDQQSIWPDIKAISETFDGITPLWRRAYTYIAECKNGFFVTKNSIIHISYASSVLGEVVQKCRRRNAFASFWDSLVKLSAEDKHLVALFESDFCEEILRNEALGLSFRNSPFQHREIPQLFTVWASGPSEMVMLPEALANTVQSDLNVALFCRLCRSTARSSEWFSERAYSECLRVPIAILLDHNDYYFLVVEQGSEVERYVSRTVFLL